jgi:hypothetical protein
MASVRPVVKVIRAKPAIEGAGVKLKRVFSSDFMTLTDPFLLLDHFGSDSPKDYLAGFPWHPHRGIETVTYMLEGEVEHGDSLGNTGVIHPGDVQWMTAGSGIIHQEMPKPHNGMMYGFQLWVNLPRAKKMVEPRYREIKTNDIPVVEKPNARIKLIAGRYKQTIGAVEGLHTEITYFDVRVWPNAQYSQDIDDGLTCLVYVYDGVVEFQGVDGYVRSEELAILGAGNLVQLRSGSDGARMLVVAGKPLREPIAWRGPIVMNTDAEIDAAFDDYYNGTFIKSKPQGVN